MTFRVQDLMIDVLPAGEKKPPAGPKPPAPCELPSIITGPGTPPKYDDALALDLLRRELRATLQAAASS